MLAPSAQAWLAHSKSEELAARFRKVIVKSSDDDFNVEEFANAGLCALHPHPDYHADIDARWYPDPGVINRSYDQAWYRIVWEDAEVEVLRLTFPTACGEQTGLDDSMRPGAATVAQLAAATDGFSYAYLKELLVASTVRWVERQVAGTMDQIMPTELAELRAQMSSVGLA